MFTFLKELWQMVKMLFSSKPNDSNELKLLAMQCFPFQGYKYMMWCGKMIYRKYGNTHTWKEYIKTIEKTIE